jgi:magnesium chelatase family protein
MVQRVSTVAFEGIEARAVDVQVQVAPGLPAFAIVGLPDKAVSEARERVRSALIALGAGAARAPDHRQSRPRRSSQRGQPL